MPRVDTEEPETSPTESVTVKEDSVDAAAILENVRVSFCNP